jgi:thioredoxin reductase (NADPH)
LRNYAAKVHLVSETLRVSEVLKKEIAQSDVKLHLPAKIKEITGDQQVTGLLLDSGTQIAATGVFIELGAKGVMELATHLGIGLNDEMKYIQTNKKQETIVPGIYAAGDICGPPWQMAKAVGEGCVAGLGAATYAKKLKL